jgi:putative membrane protein
MDNKPALTQPIAFARMPHLLLAVFLLFWTSCLIGTTDATNWWIENILVVGFVIALVATYRIFRFRDSSYALIFLFLCLHTYGAKYAYADNPLGLSIQQALSLRRNPYDRIVHCSFGLLLSMPMRDLFMNRWKMSSRAAWILPVEVVLSLSGLFELVEWSIADVFFPEHGENYVGTQGDVWDAQKDMALATAGALSVMTTAFLLFRNKKGSELQQPGPVKRADRLVHPE